MQSNFYVDKMLKSQGQEKQDIKLIKNVTAISASGGLKETKFLSNNKQVLKSIDKSDRKKGIKDRDLMSNLPAEWALGKLCDTDTNTLS